MNLFYGNILCHYLFGFKLSFILIKKSLKFKDFFIQGGADPETSGNP